MTWQWTKVVVAIGLVGLCLFLVGARDLFDALQEGTATRDAIESMLAGVFCVGLLAVAVSLKNYRPRARKTSPRLGPGGGADGRQAPREPVPVKGGRFDDLLDDERSKLERRQPP